MSSSLFEVPMYENIVNRILKAFGAQRIKAHEISGPEGSYLMTRWVVRLGGGILITSSVARSITKFRLFFICGTNLKHGISIAWLEAKHAQLMIYQVLMICPMKVA